MSNIGIYIAVAGCIAAVEVFSRSTKPKQPTNIKAEKEEYGKRMMEQKKLHEQINNANKSKTKKLKEQKEQKEQDTEQELEEEEEEKKQMEIKQLKQETKTDKSGDDESPEEKELSKEEKEKLEKEEEEAKDREEEEKEREKLLITLASHKRKMKYILYTLLFIDTIINTMMIVHNTSIFSIFNLTRLFNFSSDTYDLVFSTLIRIYLLLWFIDITIEFGDIKKYDQDRDDHKYFDIKRINKIHQGLAWIVTQFIDVHSIENNNINDDDSNCQTEMVKNVSSSLSHSDKKDDDENEELSKLKMKQTFDAQDIVKKYDNTAAEDVADFWKATLWIITFLVLTVFQAYLGVKIVFFCFPIQYEGYYQAYFAFCISIGHLQVYFAKKYINDACRPHNQYFNSDVHAHPLYKKKAKGNWCQLCWEKQKTGDIYNCRECHRHFCRKCWKKKKKAKQTGENQLRSDSKGVESTGNKDYEVTLYEYFTRVGSFHIPQIKWLSIGLISMFISSIIGVYGPKQSGKLLDKIIESDINGFYVMVVQSVLFTVITGLVGTLQTRSMQRVKEQVQCDVQTRLFGALLSQDMTFYDGTTPNNLHQRMEWGLRQMFQPFDGLVRTVLVSFVTLFGSLIMCWSISWKLTLLGMSTLGPMSYISMLFSSWSRSQMSVQWKLRSELWNIMWGSFDNIKTVRAFAREPLLTKYYSTLRKEQLDKKMRSQYMASINQTINSWLSLAAKILVTWSGGLLILRQQQNLENMTEFEQIVTVGAFVTFREYWRKLSATIQHIRRRIASFDQARFMAKQIFRTLDNQPSIERAANIKYKNKYMNTVINTDSQTDGEIDLKDIDGDISFEDVHFHYQMSPKKKVLKGVSLTIPFGKVTALVGRSGGGKSTMMHLLLRFYDPNKGKICINGVDIRKYNPYSLRRLVSLVAQDNEMFSQSIEFNVAYGVDRYNDKAIEEASTLANAHEFITKFDDGYDSRMGSRGTRVSGGQKQRINIARMLMAKPKLMLLDEATSSLDAESEALVQAALDHAIEEYKCTVVLVAHRLSTVVNADKICVVDDGQIVEEGTHDQLIHKDGIYARLVHRQMNLQSKMKAKVADTKNGKKPTADYDNIDKLIEQIKKEKEDEKKKLKKELQENKIEEEVEETWDRYDDLKLSDDEQEEKKSSESTSLFIPQNKLKNMGSVVDLLMNGPYNGNNSKTNSDKIAKVISITPPQTISNDSDVDKDNNENTVATSIFEEIEQAQDTNNQTDNLEEIAVKQ